MLTFKDFLDNTVSVGDIIIYAGEYKMKKATVVTIREFSRNNYKRISVTVKPIGAYNKVTLTNMKKVVLVEKADLTDRSTIASEKLY
jgi:hypothetical protein